MEQGCVTEKSVPRAVRFPMEVELRASPEGLESASNPTGALVAMGAGLRANSKALESPPDPKATRAARLAATSGVMGRKSAEAIVAALPWKGEAAKGRT